jgi:hypothetical protein
MFKEPINLLLAGLGPGKITSFKAPLEFDHKLRAKVAEAGDTTVPTGR